jgi:hypothetical protein
MSNPRGKPWKYLPRARRELALDKHLEGFVMKRIIPTLLALASVATAQTAGSLFTLPRPIIATSSEQSFNAIQNIPADHDMRKMSAWDQETVKLYQSTDILTLNKGTKIIVDKMNQGNGLIVFHLPGKSKLLYAHL